MSHNDIFAWPSVLTDKPSSGYHLARGGIPLHDAVGINCENGVTMENQGTGVKYWG